MDELNTIKSTMLGPLNPLRNILQHYMYKRHTSQFRVLDSGGKMLYMYNAKSDHDKCIKKCGIWCGTGNDEISWSCGILYFFFAFNITFKHIGHGEAVTQHLLCCISCNLGQVYKYLCIWWYFTGNSPAVFSVLSQREKICCFFVCVLYRAFSCSCAKGCGWCLLEPKAKTVPFIHVLAFFLYASSMIKQEMLFTAVQ